MRLLSPILPVIALLLAGCAAHNQNVTDAGKPLTPTQQITLTLHQSLATVAIVNKQLASSVIAASDAKLITTAATNDTLNWSKSVAQAVIACETVLSSGMSDAQKLEAVHNTFAALPLPAATQSILTSTQTDKTILAVIQSVQSILQSIALIQTSKVVS